MSTMKTATKGKPGATLASMSKVQAAPKPATKSVPAAAPAAPAAPFDWDSLPAAEVATYSRASATTVDREASTPGFIKAAVIRAYEQTEAVIKLAAAKGNKTTPQPVYMVQECGSPERAEEFFKLASLYGKFKGYTVRGAANPVKVAVDKTVDPTGFVPGRCKVRFAVKPRENRVKK
jgi:hypothetical protein